MNKKYIILLALLLIVVFYWFELRPAQIRKGCLAEVRGAAVRSYSDEVEPDRNKREILQERFINEEYKSCLHEKGLAE